MAEKLVFKNQETVELGYVEGDVEIRSCRFIRPQQGDTIHITGKLEIHGDIIIEGSIQVHEFYGRTRDRIVVEGQANLTDNILVEIIEEK